MRTGIEVDRVKPWITLQRQEVQRIQFRHIMAMIIVDTFHALQISALHFFSMFPTEPGNVSLMIDIETSITLNYWVLVIPPSPACHSEAGDPPPRWLDPLFSSAPQTGAWSCHFLSLSCLFCSHGQKLTDWLLLAAFCCLGLLVGWVSLYTDWMSQVWFGECGTMLKMSNVHHYYSNYLIAASIAAVIRAQSDI